MTRDNETDVTDFGDGDEAVVRDVEPRAFTEHLAERKIEVPSLFVGGGADPVLLMSPPSTMDGWVTDHRGDVIVPGAGHWVQQQAPDEVNAALVGFVDSVRGEGS